jgi:hypothetical protein
MAILPIGELGLGNEFNDDNTASSLGRISGPLLKSNLERNGIDLAFETDLLYFDATNQRIGINRDNPQYDLDVNGEVKTIELDIGEQAIIVDVLISRPNTFGTIVGPLEIRAGVDPTFTHGILETSDLRFEQNIISSFANADIVFSSNGTGTVELLKSTQVIGNVAVSGNITVDGNLSAGDNIIVGDNPFDIASVIPELSSSLIPSVNRFYNLGGENLRWRDLHIINLEGLSQLQIANILISQPASISSTVGSLNINAAGADPVATFEEIRTPNISINDNRITAITANTSIQIDTNGLGVIRLLNETNIANNLRVTGNIVMSGDLSADGNITIGDQPIDTVTIATDFTQSIIPGQDNFYDLGKSNKRWNTLISDGWEEIVNLTSQVATVSDQLFIDGINNKISATQLNQDVELLPDTGITIIERTQWQDNTLTNLNDTPIIIATTGIGYYKIGESNGIVLPRGDNSERPSTAEIGQTRWNTENPSDQYLESWDGTVWALSTGGGELVTTRFMEDLGFIYSAILG